MAALILLMVAIGLTMTNLGDGALKNALYELHKSVGLTLLSLALIRTLVRSRRGAPPLEPNLPGWQRRAAYASHAALYALIVLVPLAGWIATSSCCAPVNLFWTVPLTFPAPDGEDFAAAVFRAHFALVFVLALVAAVHIGAALHHHFIRRDNTLRRMLPGGDPR
jgi:cytochrome b561